MDEAERWASPTGGVHEMLSSSQSYRDLLDGNAVAFVFPGMPHQRCQFHYLKDATEPLYEAGRHAKTQLKKRVRGVRPLERALQERSGREAEAIRGYCLAVRSSLTDDGRAELSASGLNLQERLTQISDSIARVEGQKPFHQH